MWKNDKMKRSNETKNIYFKNGYYYVSKHFNDGEHFVGSFKTLIQALMARDWAIQNNWEHYPKTKKNSEKYITLSNNGTYCVGKTINGKTHYYGGFKTLEEAIKHRDYCVKKGWSSNCKFTNEMAGIKKTNTGYEVYCSIDGITQYVGTFYDLNEAKEIRKLYLKYNGDWESIVNEQYTGKGKYHLGFGTSFEKQKYRNDIFECKATGMY